MGLQDKFDKYSGGAGAEYFHLANDKDTAIVRFLYTTEDDVDKHGSVVIHDVEIDGKNRKVKCLLQNCPLCEAGIKNRARLLLQLIEYDEEGNKKDGGKVKVWDRGKRILPDIIDMLNRYAPLYRFTTEIVRHGEKNDPNTQYRLYPQLDDEKTFIEDTEEAREEMKELREEIIGENNMVIERDKEDLKKIAEGTFTFNNGTNDGQSDTEKTSSRNPASYF